MRFLKGDIKNTKKKTKRAIVISISKHSTILPNQKPGDVICEDGIYYMVTQYIEGEPRHYDTETVRLQLFKDCLKKLITLLESNPEIKEIAIQHYFGSSTLDQWKERKQLWKEIEDKYEVSVFVPETDEKIDNEEM